MGANQNNKGKNDDIESWIVKELSFMNELDHRILALLNSSELNGGFEHWPLRCRVVLNQLSDQANWEQVVMWVDY